MQNRFPSLFFVAAISAFAWARDFKVVKVMGRVLDGDGNKIISGQTVSSETQVNVGVNSSLVLQAGGESHTIRAMRRGTVGSLISSPQSKGKAASHDAQRQRNIADASSKVTKGISTAASRADESGDEDEAWEE